MIVKIECRENHLVIQVEDMQDIEVLKAWFNSILKKAEDHVVDLLSHP